jgi:hypothetical protein
MVGFIEAHREPYGVEPICAVFPIEPLDYLPPAEYEALHAGHCTEVKP